MWKIKHSIYNYFLQDRYWWISFDVREFAFLDIHHAQNEYKCTYIRIVETSARAPPMETFVVWFEATKGGNTNKWVYHLGSRSFA